MTHVPTLYMYLVTHIPTCTCMCCVYTDWRCPDSLSGCWSSDVIGYKGPDCAGLVPGVIQSHTHTVILHYSSHVLIPSITLHMYYHSLIPLFSNVILSLKLSFSHTAILPYCHSLILSFYHSPHCRYRSLLDQWQLWRER